MPHKKLGSPQASMLKMPCRNRSPSTSILVLDLFIPDKWIYKPPRWLQPQPPPTANTQNPQQELRSWAQSASGTVRNKT